MPVSPFTVVTFKASPPPSFPSTPARKIPPLVVVVAARLALSIMRIGSADVPMPDPADKRRPPDPISTLVDVPAVIAPTPLPSLSAVIVKSPEVAPSISKNSPRMSMSLSAAAVMEPPLLASTVPAAVMVISLPATRPTNPDPVIISPESMISPPASISTTPAFSVPAMLVLPPESMFIDPPSTSFPGLISALTKTSFAASKTTLNGLMSAGTGTSASNAVMLSFIVMLLSAMKLSVVLLTSGSLPSTLIAASTVILPVSPPPLVVFTVTSVPLSRASTMIFAIAPSMVMSVGSMSQRPASPLAALASTDPPAKSSDCLPELSTKPPSPPWAPPRAVIVPAKRVLWSAQTMTVPPSPWVSASASIRMPLER